MHRKSGKVCPAGSSGRDIKKVTKLPPLPHSSLGFPMPRAQASEQDDGKAALLMLGDNRNLDSHVTQESMNSKFRGGALALLSINGVGWAKRP
jgi:hypothetical protein